MSAIIEPNASTGTTAAFQQVADLLGGNYRGKGAYRVGGRWNSHGARAVECALDPATATLEVAVHKGADPASIHVVRPDDVPNPNWLRPGIPGPGQQAFGDETLGAHRFVLIPSAVSTHSWNLVFIADRAAEACERQSQGAFALDPRLHPATA